MTIRFKVTMGSVAVVLVLNTLLSLATVKHLGQTWLREIQTRVRLDLHSARAAYQSNVTSIARFVGAAALSDEIASAVASDNRDALGPLLDEYYRASGLDMLNVLGPDGRVLHRSRPTAGSEGSLADNPLVAEAIEQNASASGTVLLDATELQAEGPELAERASFELLETPAARPTADNRRTEGMVVAAVLPVKSGDGKLVGWLYGGTLLNRRYELVDAIRSQVFPDHIYQGRHIGTVTIFQEDLRIATNVMNRRGERAVGTRVSDEVYRRVLERGEIFDDRAFVVNDWYITAYEPIRDPTGRIIGALYVGLLEAPFANRQNLLIGVFLVLVGAASVGSLLLMFVVANHVLRPIGGVIGMCRRVVKGDLTARVESMPPGEMGELCRAVNDMAEAVAEREAQLKERTTQQISQSEKLASVGRLAAGVAHEINNPLTGVLTFAHLLRDKPNMDDQDRQDLDLILHETTRVAEIVRGLLDFARERPPAKAMLDLNQIVRQTVRLVASQSQFKKIQIAEQLDDHLPAVYGDKNQLQQVLLNLALNACEAMPDGGHLTIRTRPHGNEVMLQVTDTGSGIKPEHINQVFDPFFTTKPAGKGTGLGLSVTYGIIQQHGGAIGVDSEEGQGTTFSVTLPLGNDGSARDDDGVMAGKETP